MSAVQTIPVEEFVNIRARDFAGARRVELDSVPSTATVGEVVHECAREMQLPLDKFYHALFRGRELPHSDTLGEAGIREGEHAEIEIVPDVSAG